MATTTPNRGYQLPAAGSKLKDDVLRLIGALGLIDADVADLLLALADKSNVGHGHGMDAITGLVAALGNKLDVGYHDALANLTDVDVAGVANGMALLRQASKWIPVALQINNIAGLETALNGKATPADITTAINALVAAAPGALDTLNELAAALGNDPNFSATVTAAIAAKLAKSQNLADLPDKAAARANLDVPSSTAFQTLLDGVIRKDQDQNAQALAAALKINILKNGLQCWEQVGPRIVVASPVPNVSWTNLSQYRQLRLTGLLIPSVAGGSFFARTGAGAFDSGGTDYLNQTMDAFGSTMGPSLNNSSGIFVTSGTGASPLGIAAFELNVEAFNFPAPTLFRSWVNYGDGANRVARIVSGIRAVNQECDRLQIIHTTGNISPDSYLVLEGIRG